MINVQITTGYSIKRYHITNKGLKAMTSHDKVKVSFTAEDNSLSECGQWKPFGKPHWGWIVSRGEDEQQSVRDTKKRKREDETVEKVQESSHHQEQAAKDGEEV